MRIVIDSGVLSRVFPSEKRAGRVYVDVIDLKSNGGRFSFSSDVVSFPELKAVEGSFGKLDGDFEVFSFDNKMQFKGVDVKWVSVSIPTNEERTK